MRRERVGAWAHPPFQHSCNWGSGEARERHSGLPGESGRGASARSDYAPPEAATGAASAPGDVWQLGMTLVEVLTQRLPIWDRAHPNSPQIPAAMPEPLRAIAEHCLQVDPAKRWTLRANPRLFGREAASTDFGSEFHAGITVPAFRRRGSNLRNGPIGSWHAAVVLAVVFFLARPKPANPPAESSNNTGRKTRGSPRRFRNSRRYSQVLRRRRKARTRRPAMIRRLGPTRPETMHNDE